MEKYIINLLLSFGLSLAIVMLIMPRFINLLKSLNYNQEVSEYALDEFKEKEKKPSVIEKLKSSESEKFCCAWLTPSDREER